MAVTFGEGKNTFKVRVKFEYFGNIFVRADDESEALELASKLDPDDAFEDSFYESIEISQVKIND